MLFQIRHSARSMAFPMEAVVAAEEEEEEEEEEKE